MTEIIKSLIDDTLPLVSNLANVSAALSKLGNLNWCGFYIAEKETLYLGPFQGDPACTRIPFGKGVCGTAARRRETVVVPDVSKFPGHIACSATSKSEIVVPILKDGETVAVIDLDAPIYDRFRAEDAALLESVAACLAPLF